MFRVLHPDIASKFQTPDSVNDIKQAIQQAQVSVHARDVSYALGLLHFAVMNIKDDTEFESFLLVFLNHGGNINLINKNGLTALDVAPHGTSEGDMHYKSSLLLQYGGKFGREISNIQANIAEQAILPGYNALDNQAPVRGFLFEKLKLVSVRDYLKGPIKNTTYDSSVDLRDIFESKASGIGKLFAEEEFISTCLLISEDWILTARHSVNFRTLSDLAVVIQEETIAIDGVIESGVDVGLDYLILKLARTPILADSLTLTSDNTSTSVLFMGYYSSQNLVFSAFPNENIGGLAVVAYQQTGAGLSGSAYFDLDGEVCGLHSRASATEKTGLYIRTIVENKPNSVLASLMRKENVSHIRASKVIEVFQEFTNVVAAFNEFDEGLKITFQMVGGSAQFSAEDRPSNQSDKKVQNKIKKRLQDLQTAGKTLTDVQQAFVARADYNLIDNDIHIAHNIAISEMKNTIIEKMNTSITKAEQKKEKKAVQDFADAIASSDDETGPKKSSRVKKKLPALIQKIRDKQNNGNITSADAKELQAEAKHVLDVLNRRSKNLMPGHALVNISVSDFRDPHLIIEGGRYKETDISKQLSKTAEKFFGKAYTPKVNANGEYLSSSVNSDNVTSDAYYKP